ncbi:hypothetical protein [Treponema pectinovorum]|uniref:hypothetical protein n=1 Tax=Treponema pectinovorum TaxID=164 RepID=UPI0011C8BAE2|nr:hypothetical protein [Treponema pectinovorum]
MKKLLVTSLFIALSAAVFAFDWGGSFSNTSKFANQNAKDGLKVNQKNALNLWGKYSLNSTDYFLIQGKYQFEHDFGQKKTLNSINIDIAKYEMIKGDFTINAGRFFYSDLSKIIYTQNGDGVLVNFNKPTLKAKAYGFYTGLLNSRFVTILGDSQTKNDDDKIYLNCEKYAVAGLQFSFPEIWKEQTISTEFLWSSKLSSGKLNRGYLQAAIKGSLTEGFFYEVNSVLGLLQQQGNDTKFSNLSKAEIFYYPNFKNSQISLKTVYTTGNSSKENSKKSGFYGFTSNTAVKSMEEDEYTSIFMCGLSASIKPISSVFLSAGFDTVFKTDENNFKYKGFQYATNLYYQLLSDVLLGCDFSQYFDKNNSDINKTALTLKVSLTF